MVAPAIVAAIIGAVGSAAQQKMAADQANQQMAQQGANATASGAQQGGGLFGSEIGSGTDEFMRNAAAWTAAGPGGQDSGPRPGLFSGDTVPQSLGPSPLEVGSEGNKYITTLRDLNEPSGNVMPGGGGGSIESQMASAESAPRPKNLESGGEGFDADKTMQYAAMAAQLGSMFAPPPAPPPPGLPGGGGGWKPESYTMRMMQGG